MDTLWTHYGLRGLKKSSNFAPDFKIQKTI